MTISRDQIEAIAEGIGGKTPPVSRPVPKVSTVIDNSCYLVFSKVTVPTYRVLHIKKNTTVGLGAPGEAVLCLQGVDKNAYDVPTGDQYDELIGRMFK